MITGYMQVWTLTNANIKVPYGGGEAIVSQAVL